MPAIRRQVNIAAPQRAVWNALTTSEGLCEWWADDARLEGRKGGRVVISTADDEGNPIEERGFIHSWRPTSKLEITFDNIGDTPHKGTHLAFSLALDDGETRLAIVLSGAVTDDEERRKALDKEWKAALRALQEFLDAA